MSLETCLDVPDEKLDASERGFVANIREHGWTATHVYPDETGPGFGYTTGFFQTLGVPDLICFSLPKETLHDIFWDLFRRQKDGVRFNDRELTDQLLGNNVNACFLPVAPERFKDHLTWTNWFHLGRATTAWQIVWPDKTGRFPFSKDASPELLEWQHDMSAGNWAEMQELPRP